jgi:hypothetical protein
MVLKEQELLQIDEKFIRKLQEKNPDALVGLSIRLTNDLKEAMERLNQNSSNSSNPSGSLAPWDKGLTEEESDSEDELTASEQETSQADSNDDPEEATNSTTDTNENSPCPVENEDEQKKPGRQPGSPGFGRTQQLKVTEIKHHSCGFCSACQQDLTPLEKAYTGFQTINIEFGQTDSPGVTVSNTQHTYYMALCPQCGLENRSHPHRAPADDTDWSHAGMTEWRLIGADLAALIVYLSMDMRVSRRKIKTFLLDVFGIELSIGVLQNCIIESARALEPVEQQLINDLSRDSLMHADETSHNEGGERLWLWVFITSSTALFLIGYRSKEIFTNLIDALAPDFNGHLMTDGYRLYRSYLKRLRCWAHLLRKAKGLQDSYTEASQIYGKQVYDSLNRLISSVYAAREGPDQGTLSISADHQGLLENLRTVCEKMSVSSHQKTAELGREILNDWEAIFRVLDYPAWPLTNNEAERALRHWVILRKISQGTRSEQGSRALALFASVFTTCRLRKSSPLVYIREVISRRRRGLDLPKLPAVPALIAA